MPQVIQVQLELAGSHIVFNPTLDECWVLIRNAFMEVIQSAEKLPRVHNTPYFPVVNLTEQCLDCFIVHIRNMSRSCDEYSCFGQVECFVFPDIKSVYLRTVTRDEPLVTNILNIAKEVHQKNTVGPQKY